MKTKNRRWRLFADAKIQGIVCLRIVVYWLACQIAVFATIAALASLNGAAPDADASVVRFFVPALFVSMCILPLALFDALAFTNRFTGPLLNFRQKFHKLAAAEDVDPLKFRQGDYFPDLEDNFNRLRNVILQRQRSGDEVMLEETSAAL